MQVALLICFGRRGAQALTLTFVTRIEKTDDGFAVTLVNRDGVETVGTRALVLATGCRERTAKQVSIHGTRPSGVFTAGTAQHFTNLLGELPTRKCVILGSGDIGLIMARRLTLEGAQVLGVYEAKPTPSGLTRNIHQCLHDYDIPLHLSHTVTRVMGQDRLTAVEVSQVDERMRPIAGTEEIIACDALILSVGLIPENELAEGLGVLLDPRTKGPKCNAQLMTSVDGVFSCRERPARQRSGRLCFGKRRDRRRERCEIQQSKAAGDSDCRGKQPFVCGTADAGPCRRQQQHHGLFPEPGGSERLPVCNHRGRAERYFPEDTLSCVRLRWKSW